MDLNFNLLGWFEIPVNNMQRAIGFYEKVFQLKMVLKDFGPAKMAFFPMFDDKPGSSGSLVHYPDEYQSSQSGVLIYFSSMSGDLNDELSRIEEAGGKIIKAKKLIAEDIGYMALFLDTEGNRIALHGPL